MAARCINCWCLPIALGFPLYILLPYSCLPSYVSSLFSSDLFSAASAYVVFFPCSFILLPFPTRVPVHHLPLWVCDLLLHLVRFVFSVSARMYLLMTSLCEPIHPSTLACTSGTPGRTSIPRTSPTLLWSAITSVRGTPAVDATSRQPCVCYIRDGRIGVVKVRVWRTVLDATPIRRGFTVARRLDTNLD